MTPWSLENLKNNWVLYIAASKSYLAYPGNIQDQDIPIVPTADWA
jgi:hypothetical protein